MTLKTEDVVRSPLGHEQLVALAKEAGFETEQFSDKENVIVYNFQSSETDITEQLERFAALVQFASANARAEREEWVDLTCEEVTALIREGAAGGGWQGFATRLQDAFKEKNK